jgi:hypothetical protein
MHKNAGMHLKKAILVGSLAAGLLACSPKPLATSGRASDYNGYNEDLSVARPVYASTGIKAPTAAKIPNTTPTPELPTAEARKITNVGSAEALHVNRKVEENLTEMTDKNRSVRYAPGFRIQVYVGNERQQAETAKLQVYQNFPELAPYLSYSQPTYKLKVGDFMHRIDAERYYSQIKQVISSAQLIPDKVEIRRSLLIR